MNRQDARSARTAREPDSELDDLARQVISCAIEVHKYLGPGWLEALYERALCVEMRARGLDFARQVPTRLHYKGEVIGEGRIDLIVAERLIVELKAIEALAPAHALQVRSYMKSCGHRLGLLINFNVPVLLRGVVRIVNTPLTPGGPGGPGG